METDTLRKIKKLFTCTERYNTETLWEELSFYLLNNQSGIFHEGHSNHNRGGERKTKNLYVSEPATAARDLASALHGVLTNPVSLWFDAKFKDEELNNNSEATEWLEKSVKKAHARLKESNFDTEAQKAYQDLSTLATFVLFHESLDDTTPEFSGHNFKTIHLSKVAFTENAKGRVDEMAIKLDLTARQYLERFGEKALTPEIEDALEEAPDKMFRVWHYIYPNKKENIDIDETTGTAEAKKRPFLSEFIEDTTGTVIKVTGYYEFPAYVVRWSTLTGEVYGRGPGHLALPDIKSLNTIRYLKLGTGAKAMDPPIITKQRNIIGSLNLNAGGVTVSKNPEGFNQFVTEARIDWTQLIDQEVTQAIKSMFYLDKLQLPPRTETGEMTAYEVSRRIAEVNKILGPVFSRLNSEFLSPLMIRTFRMMFRGGEFGDLPGSIKDLEPQIDITFINPLAKAQQAEDLGNIEQFLVHIAQSAELHPESVDSVEWDDMHRHYGKGINIPEKLLASKEKMAKMRQQRQQASQQAQALEQMKIAGQANSQINGV